MTNKKKKCLMCGDRFVPKDGRQKYCSDTCREDMNRIKADERYWDNKKELRPRKCKVCGEWYIPDRKNQTTCSNECGQIRNAELTKERFAKLQKQKVKTYPKTKCPICGKKFHNSGKKVYCSEECYKEGNKRKAYERYLAKKSVDKGTN